MIKNIFLENYINNLFEKTKVKIPIKKGDLGLSLDDPIIDYKEKINSGKKWDEMSQQLNALEVLNKNKNPDISKKVNKIRTSLSNWIENKRKTNTDFGK